MLIYEKDCGGEIPTPSLVYQPTENEQNDPMIVESDKYDKVDFIIADSSSSIVANAKLIVVSIGRCPSLAP